MMFIATRSTRTRVVFKLLDRPGAWANVDEFMFNRSVADPGGGAEGAL